MQMNINPGRCVSTTARKYSDELIELWVRQSTEDLQLGAAMLAAFFGALAAQHKSGRLKTCASKIRAELRKAKVDVNRIHDHIAVAMNEAVERDHLHPEELGAHDVAAKLAEDLSTDILAILVFSDELAHRRLIAGQKPG